ncbi:hypothetical protein [uncultured Rikenella sp.]|uniref:hypothetical protein n=1 Tax=uncultured Rikenella sp. TaxID=368003 RepID=UPI0025DCAE19|nr:hypothetical protein [uncultured Rikenella sp.]
MTKLNLLFPASPAPGFRDAGNNGLLGELLGVGNYGYNWSSASSGTNGVSLSCLMTHLNPGGPNYRGIGFQLRCLSE